MADATDTEWTREDIEPLIAWLKEAGDMAATAKQALGLPMSDYAELPSDIELAADRLFAVLTDTFPK